MNTGRFIVVLCSLQNIDMLILDLFLILNPSLILDLSRILDLVLTLDLSLILYNFQIIHLCLMHDHFLILGLSLILSLSLIPDHSPLFYLSLTSSLIDRLILIFKLVLDFNDSSIRYDSPNLRKPTCFCSKA